MFKQTLFFIVVSFIFCISFLPLLSILTSAFSDGFSLDIFYSSSLFESFKRSMLFSLLVASSTTLTGVVLGMILAKTKLSYSKLFTTILIIPILIPPYIIALGWYELFGRNEFLFGFFGTFLVHFSIYLPIPLLLTILFLKQVNPKYENAARLFTNWRGVLRYITLPLISPSIVLSFLFVFILSFSEYSVANFFRYKLFSLESFVQFSAFYDFKSALLLSLPLVFTAVILLLFEQYILQKNKFKFDSSYKIEYIKINKYQTYLFLAMLIFVSVIALTPLLSLFAKACDLEAFEIALHKSYEPLLRTLFYSFLGSFLLVVFGFFAAFIIEKNIFKIGNIFDTSLIALFAMPSTIIGISLIFFFNTPYTNFIYMTPLIILFGYITKYLALTSKITGIKLSQIPNSVIEAAQISGASWSQTILYITLPLLKKTLLITWLIAFIFTLRENTITMLVYPPGYETLPIYIVTQMANGKAEVIAGLSIIMIAAALLPLAVLGMVTKEKS